MIVLGLTGSIGMGKSTVAQMFRDEGVPVFDADACVHHLQGPGGRLVPAIESAFPGTTGPEGVNRAALGQAVLGDDAAMRRLEAIVHPAVQAERAAFLAAHAGASLVVVDVPLLFETGGDKAVDKVLVVSAKPDVQEARVLKRLGMTKAKFAAILARQMPDADKRARADHVVATDIPLAETREKVRTLIACMTASEGR
ncbi:MULTISPECIES: dephospho-CoA kinase [Sphingomonas]|jgi:dephospho-CoA kinase|uniref:Dephospho-CoA kinase n=1 Tax=Sphingomonas zeae TaxID=1646122 RepID=A0A7Y6B4V8_9SPHN|nr:MULTISPECIES: dephospho-CoA kinase [Sphingomonas]MBB4049005.1 dephospho-CoA kinase [Sphingomonas zeae]MDK8187335.1 dephospho-CoA kinase [Sphingomonas zeae]MDK8217077.1 dephospho-CoA kinase [Sphingomonas sp. UMB7805-LC452B]NUU46472.1 dephospho-CoA kinase [Sphingomonas zeae]